MSNIQPKQFTIYIEMFRLIDRIGSTEKRDEFLGKLFDWYFTDEKPNLENTEYTENEKDGNFELRYIPLLDVENVLKTNAEEYGDENGIAKEMIDLFEVYKTTINE